MVHQLLTNALNKAKVLPLNKDTKYILFSDLHKGNNSYADDFSQNMRIYRNALHHYYINDFTYIELGDGIELWENRKIGPILKAHKVIFDLLADFHNQKRLHLIYGNHDMIFRFPWFIKRLLGKVLPNLTYHESILLQTERVHENILLLHGHQADYMNYLFWWLNRFLVRYVWKPLQYLGFNDPTSPAKNTKERDKVESRMANWIINNNNQVVIFGHTHRPIFPSYSKPILKEKNANNNELSNSISKNKDQIPMFNTGSCVHPDAIIGIEIENMKIAMVKWHYNEKGSEVVKEYLEGPVSLR